MASDSNRPVMVYEGSLKPSQRAGGRPDRQADFIEIPFPGEEELHATGEADAELAVTLVLPAEPTDNLTRRAYVGDVVSMGPPGSDRECRRIPGPHQPRCQEATSVGTRSVALVRLFIRGEYQLTWLPARNTSARPHPSVQAAAIAGSRLLAVYPCSGGGKTHARDGQRPSLPVVVSVDLGDVDSTSTRLEV